MTKPKNMTPEQEAAWKERDKARRSTPGYKTAALLRVKTWRNNNSKHRNTRENDRYNNDAEYYARKRQRNIEYKKKKRLEREYERFMRRLKIEEEEWLIEQAMQSAPVADGHPPDGGTHLLTHTPSFGHAIHQSV